MQRVVVMLLAEYHEGDQVRVSDFERIVTRHGTNVDYVVEILTSMRVIDDDRPAALEPWLAAQLAALAPALRCDVHALPVSSATAAHAPDLAAPTPFASTSPRSSPRSPTGPTRYTADDLQDDNGGETPSVRAQQPCQARPRRGVGIRWRCGLLARLGKVSGGHRSPVFIHLVATRPVVEPMVVFLGSAHRLCRSTGGRSSPSVRRPRTRPGNAVAASRSSRRVPLPASSIDPEPHPRFVSRGSENIGGFRFGWPATVKNRRLSNRKCGSPELRNIRSTDLWREGCRVYPAGESLPRL
jgi:hypothetical protein